MKIACFYYFLRKNQFLPIFYTQNDHFSIFEGVLMTSYISGWYLFWWMKRGCPYLYTVVNLGLYDISIGNPEGGCNNPTSENMIWKTLRRTRFNVTITFCLVYSIYLSIFHQLVLHSSTLVAILIKKRPHTTFCAPCHEGDDDVYLAMNRKSGYDFSVSNIAIFKQ